MRACHSCFKALTWWSTDKERELSEAQAEIKALKLSERQREKAVEEVRLSLIY